MITLFVSSNVAFELEYKCEMRVILIIELERNDVYISTKFSEIRVAILKENYRIVIHEILFIPSVGQISATP